MQDKIEKVRFNNYKSFLDINKNRLDITKPVCLIIGRNSSGKSSVIDVFEYIFSLEKSMATTFNGAEIQLGFTITDDCLAPFNSSYYMGEISYNPYGYAKQFEGQTIWAKCENIKNNTYKDKIIKAFKFSLVEQDEHQVDVEDKNTWNTVAVSYLKFSKAIVFRRINAERDIVPEIENPHNLSVNYNGNGTTNIIREYINDSKLDEKLVEKLLLRELNKIMEKDACFESIRIQQVEHENQQKWEIFLKEPGQGRFALSQSGSGLKTIILMLVNLYLLPALQENKDKIFVFAFEELENNLHPALQRRVFDYLYSFSETHDVRIFLTSHSHVAINVFYGKERANIYHVSKVKRASSVKAVESYFEKVELLEDLDVKASDILQSNGIIWVEGPSDRIYIKRWLEVFTDNRFMEGRDYQFLYYGGKILSHYELGGDDNIKGLISILTTNRHAAIVIDSDKRYRSGKINETKLRIKEEFEKQKFMCWITKGKEIENYITANSINRAFGVTMKKDIGQYELFPEYINDIDAHFSNRKILFAKKVASGITSADEALDLKDRILELYQNIKKWNE